MDISPVNNIVNFNIDHTAIAGILVKLDKEINKVLKLHQYPENISRLLAELIILNIIVSSTIRDFSLVSLQIKSTNSPIKLMAADYYSDGRIRGYADFNPSYFHNDYLEKKRKLSDYFGGSNILVKVEMNGKTQQHTIVELRGESITESIEHYFNIIQQIKTKIKVIVGKINNSELGESWCVSGIVIQSLPQDSYHIDIVKDDWSMVSDMFNNIEDHELLDTLIPLPVFLSAIFYQNTITIQGTTELRQGCQCNVVKFDELYNKLVLDDSDLLKANDKVIVRCEFCGNKKEYLGKKRDS